MKKNHSYIQIFCFALPLFGLGIASLFVKPGGVSQEEKRALAPVPAYTSRSLWSGSYTDSLEMYFADNFPGRDPLIRVSFALKNWRGMKSEEIAFYTPKAKPPVPGAKPGAAAVVDTGDAASMNGEVNKGVFITEGRAMQIFGGSVKMGNLFAETANKFAEAMPAHINLYCMIAPTAGEFYIRGKHRKMYRSETENIANIHSGLSARIRPVDAVGKLREHSAEYLFFNTDHHWTARGAYYAYAATCERMGITPTPLESMPTGVICNFLGSLYWLTRDPKLEKNKDSVVYYQVPGNYKAVCYTAKNPGKAMAASLLAKMASGSNAYSVFLGGDYPLMKIDNPGASPRRLLILKNSYGNPYSAFFVSHFEKTFIVDYRYFEGGVMKLVKEEGITDIVIAYGSFSANTPWHIRRLNHIIKPGKPAAPAAPAKPVPSTPKDSARRP
jgi:hypothetical protein